MQEKRRVGTKSRNWVAGGTIGDRDLWGYGNAIRLGCRCGREEKDRNGEVGPGKGGGKGKRHQYVVRTGEKFETAK